MKLLIMQLSPISRHFISLGIARFISYYWGHEIEYKMDGIQSTHGDIVSAGAV
jgi:hypothetical protein